MFADESEITDEMISARAFELSQSDESGSADENWNRAEQELRPGNGPWAKTSSGDTENP